MVAVTLLGATAAIAAPDSPGTPRYGPGSDGAGDPYFPLAGNGGSTSCTTPSTWTTRPRHPTLPRSKGTLAGVATIDLVATADLDRFNLDLRGLTATSVVVNGKSMAFDQVENELRVSPRPKLKTGRETATVVVTYGGTTIQPDRHRGRTLRLGDHA